MASDDLPTIWAAEPHTWAKHEILKSYLRAWAPIMSNQLKKGYLRRRQFTYIDGFAGPGIYAGGQDGSPILALTVVLEHSVDFPVPIDFIFIENDRERYDQLCSCVNDIRAKYHSHANFSRIRKILPIFGDCRINLEKEIERSMREDGGFGPALCFLDQFGYSEVPMELIKKIMGFRACEVLMYLNWSQMNHYLTDKSKWPTFDRTFGDNCWDEVLQLPGKNRHTFISDCYKTALRQKANIQYVWNFNMLDQYNKPIHWLYFGTNNLTGLKEMKTAMWRVGRKGHFCFSDKDDPDQYTMLSDFSVETMATVFAQKLAGEVRSAYDLQVLILTDTPAYKFREILIYLEKKGRIEIIQAPEKRRKCTFPDKYLNDIIIRFP